MTVKVTPTASHRDYGGSKTPPAQDQTGGGGGSGAPDDLAYLTVGDETADLPNSRQIDCLTPIAGADNGPGQPYQIGHVVSGVAAATYGGSTTYPVVAVNATGHVTSASNQSLPDAIAALYSTLAFWGDGSSGALVFDGVNAVTGFTLAGSTYTVTGGTIAILATSIQVDSGVTVVIATNPTFCTGTFTLNGTWQHYNNKNASGASSGSGAAGGINWTGQGANGVNGSTTSAAGTGASPSLGGSGGNGGANSTPTAGGNGGTATPPTAIQGDTWWPGTPVGATTAHLHGSLNVPQGGASGGTGRGSGGLVGGASGAGGGGVAIYARVLAGNGTVEARGGNGGAGPNTNTGGGGGGGGGYIILVTTTQNHSWTLDVSGGTGGAGNGGGSTGSTGASGRAYQVFIPF